MLHESVLRNGRRLHGFGLGAAPPPQIPSLAALTSGNPAFQNSWNQIQTQLQAEGADTTQFQSAQNALVGSWTQLSQQLGVSGDQALSSATQYVMIGQTVAGAVSTIQGLVATATSGAPPATVMQAFTGTMIGALIGAGALSAGVGAAIVGAVDAVLQILQSNGFFGQPPQGTQICPGVYCSGASFTVGCVCAFDLSAPSGGQAVPAVSPSSTAWRAFPDPTSAADAAWFGPMIPGGFQWKGLNWSPGNTSGSPKIRPIDIAFPQYHQLECDVAAPGPLQPFQQAFFAAWKTNAAYAFNALKPQNDTAVLAHAGNLWNRAHTTGGSSTVLAPAAGVLLPWDQPCSATTTSYGVGIAPSYAATLAQQVINNPVAALGASGQVMIQTAPAGASPLPVLPPVKASPAPAAASTSSNAGAVALGAAGAGLVAGGALYAYAQAHGLTMSQALRRLLGG